MSNLNEITKQENLIAFLIKVNDEDRILEKSLNKEDQKHSGKALAKGLIQYWFDQENCAYMELSQAGRRYLTYLPQYLPDYMSSCEGQRQLIKLLDWINSNGLLSHSSLSPNQMVRAEALRKLGFIACQPTTKGKFLFTTPDGIDALNSTPPCLRAKPTVSCSPVMKEYAGDQKMPCIKEAPKEEEVERAIRDRFRNAFSFMETLSFCSLPVSETDIPESRLPGLKDAINNGWVDVVVMTVADKQMHFYSLSPQGKLVLTQYLERK